MANQLRVPPEHDETVFVAVNESPPNTVLQKDEPQLAHYSE
jgi:hypothetical protein